MKNIYFYKIIFTNLLFFFLIIGCSTDSSSSEEKKKIQFTYSSPLSYYPETSANDGVIDNAQFITVTVVAGNFIDEVANNANFTKDTHFTSANLPTGLTMQVTKLSATTAKITFSGKAISHAIANNISNGKITFLAAAIKETNIQFDGTESKSDIKIKFLQNKKNIQFTYSSSLSHYPEVNANNGAIDNAQFITVTVVGGNFIDEVANNANFTKDTHFTSANLPTGLTMQITKLSATTAKITFSGKAISHALANNISNGKITFLAAAIKETNIQFDGTESKSNIEIKFLAEPTFTFTSEATAPAGRGGFVPLFLEVVPDDGDDNGKIDNSKPSTITLGGTGVFSEDVAVGSPFPANNYELSVNGAAGETRGYTVVVTKTSSTTARITLEGKYNGPGSASGIYDYAIRFILKPTIIEGPAKLGASKDTSLSIIFDPN